MAKSLIPKVYDNKVVASHSIYLECKNNLNALSKKDYPKDSFFSSDIECLDLDSYEGKRAKGKPDKTMDAAVGIDDYINNRIVNPRLLLIELRMDYKSTDTLDVNTLRGKIQHSRVLLGSELRIDEDNYFIFRDNIAEKAKKWMFSISNEKSDAKKWKALSTSDLSSMLQDVSQMPYIPENDMTMPVNQIRQLITQHEFDKLLGVIDYWNTKAETFKQNYNHSEYNNILTGLKEAWQTLDPIRQVLKDDDLLIVEFIEDEYRYLK